jgi:hypothetical protein
VEAIEWKRKIKQNCKDAGTYKPVFDPVIDTLAGIMEKRDYAEAVFEDEGKQVIVEHTNKGGATNYEQNPLIRLINDLNRDALAYWRDLGLTPAGLKKINETAIKAEVKESALEIALKSIGGTELGRSKEIRGVDKGRKKGSVRGTKASRK